MFKYNIEEIYYLPCNKIFIKGWIVNFNNDTKIRLSINKNNIGYLKTNTVRDDVFEVFKDKTSTNILGFEKLINSDEKINYMSIDLCYENGVLENVLTYKQDKLNKLKKDKKNILYNIESIEEIEGKVIIRGWAFSKYYKEMSIKLNIKEQYEVKKYLRDDVSKAYKTFKTTENCGFEIEYNFDKKSKDLTIEFNDDYNKVEHQIDTNLQIKGNCFKYTIKNLNYNNFKKGISYIKKYGYKALLNKMKGDNMNISTYPNWLKDNLPTLEQREYQKEHKFKYEPLISVIIPTYNTPKELLTQAIESVLNQTYLNYELCIADGKSKEETVEVLKLYEEKYSKINIKYLNENKGISENSNEAIALAKGEYITLFDHDDLLEPNALFEVVKSINKNKNLDIIYTDEDKIDEHGNRKMPFFKPDWSQDLLYSQMYICHMLTFRKSLFYKIGRFRKDYDGSQDYDLMLRMSRETDNIYHIPKVLYSWRELSTSTSINPDSKPYAHIAGFKALNDHLNIKYKGSAYAEQTENLYVYDCRFKIKKNLKISIIIPTKDKVDLIKQCVNSIEDKTNYKNYEILIMNNNSIENETYEWFEEITKKNNIRVVEANYEFNWSKLNNHGIKEASGDVFIFLNNDTIVISEDWIERLAENAIRDEIGTVGALLLYEDNTIQHSGVVLGMGGWADHVYKGVAASHLGSPYISPIINRNVLASTGACLAISRKTIEKIGTFNENFIICGSDVEISLRAREHGLSNMLNSRAKLYHLESKSRDSFIPEIDFKMSEKHYRRYLDSGDPYYNPNLDLNSTSPKISGRLR